MGLYRQNRQIHLGTDELVPLQFRNILLCYNKNKSVRVNERIGFSREEGSI
jgi:hypothetical protein